MSGNVQEFLTVRQDVRFGRERTRRKKYARRIRCVAGVITTVNVQHQIQRRQFFQLHVPTIGFVVGIVGIKRSNCLIDEIKPFLQGRFREVRLAVAHQHFVVPRGRVVRTGCTVLNIIPIRRVNKGVLIVRCPRLPFGKVLLHLFTACAVRTVEIVLYPSFIRSRINVCVPLQFGNKIFLQTSEVYLGHHQLVELIIKTKLSHFRIVFAECINRVIRYEELRYHTLVRPPKQIHTVCVCKGCKRIHIRKNLCVPSAGLIRNRHDVVTCRFCKPNFDVLAVSRQFICIVRRGFRRYERSVVEERRNLKELFIAVRTARFRPSRFYRRRYVQQEFKQVVGRVAITRTIGTFAPISVVHVREPEAVKARMLRQFFKHLVCDDLNHGFSVRIRVVGHAVRRIAKFRHDIIRFFSIGVINCTVIGSTIEEPTLIRCIPGFPRALTSAISRGRRRLTHAVVYHVYRVVRNAFIMRSRFFLFGDTQSNNITRVRLHHVVIHNAVTTYVALYHVIFNVRYVSLGVNNHFYVRIRRMRIFHEELVTNRITKEFLHTVQNRFVSYATANIHVFAFYKYFRRGIFRRYSSRKRRVCRSKRGFTDRYVFFAAAYRSHDGQFYPRRFEEHALQFFRRCSFKRHTRRLSARSEI